MLIQFPYTEVPPLEVPDDRIGAILEPHPAEPPGGLVEEDIIREGLDSPIGEKPISIAARRKRRVVILVDDLTRSTPVQKVLPPVLANLDAAGISRKNISILVALGTHRPMTSEETTARFGDQLARDYKIVMHTSDENELLDVGEAHSGMPIQVNPLALDADFLLAVGRIVPHGVAGFSGGSKMVLPGICGKTATGRTHWMSTDSPMEEILGLRDNPVRREMDSVALRVGLSYIVNVVQATDGRILRVFAGDFEEAHERGCEYATEIYGCPFERPYPIVVADAFPATLDLWQAAKAIYASELVVEEEGVIILVALCREGVSVAYPQLSRYGYLFSDEARSLFEQGEIPDLVLASHMARVGRVARGKARVILVSPGVSREVANRMGLLWASSAKEALEKATRLTEKRSKICIMKSASQILPIPKSR